MFKMTIVIAVVLSLNWALLTACKSINSTQHIEVVQNLDLEKYMGTWYEIARMPNHFEEDMEFVTAQYSLMPNGRVKVINSGIKNGTIKKVEGEARTANNLNNGELEVVFVRPFWSQYRIIYLSDDYQTAIVTGSHKKLLWILSRTPKMQQDDLLYCLSKINDWGFDTSKLYFQKTK